MKKKSASVWNFSKGGGSCPNPNFSRNFFVLFMFGHFFRNGGVALFQTFGGTFLLEFGRFSGRGGGLPDSKKFEELFCLSLDIFQ